MKASDIKILVLLLIMILFPVIFPKQASAQQAYVNYQVFYDQLSPYGQWVNYPSYGYVWLPDAGPGFFPYSSGGHWIMTDYGWTWFSDYDWGWAPFHYGRWDYDNYYGWFWVPDYVWGPAWVSWRRTDGYYGWSPMGPGISMNMSFGGDYNSYDNYWVFVNERYFGRANNHRYSINQDEYEQLFINSTVIDNTYNDNNRQTIYISGPNLAEVQRVAGRRVNSFEIQDNNVPGQYLNNRQFSTYRPQINKNDESQQRAIPSRITDLEDIKQPSERNSEVRQRTINSNGASTRVQQQDAVDRLNTINRRKASDRQDAVDQQNDVNRQNAMKRQDAVNRQNTINNRREQEQINVNRQNAANRQSAVDLQNNVNRQNAEDQQKSVIRQNEVNRLNAEDQNKVLLRQNSVNPQNNMRTTNVQSEQATNAADATKNIRSGDSKNPVSEKDKKR